MSEEERNGHGPLHAPASEPLHIERGTVIGIPVVNVPGFLASIRCFDEDSKQDLNRLMPGKKDGSAPQQYAYAFFNKVIVHLDYLIDLHTASLGRRNSLLATQCEFKSSEIFKDVADIVQPGELIAEVQTIFGDVVERIVAPDFATIVVGVEGNPVAKTGSRVIHLGVIGDTFEVAKGDGHL
ncbi:hypothetical protein Sste5346_008864 [Sporothrix stenoceras]|uniref:Succinylglutamate desuccinylase/Aspartoacylase catalytic domain-containing protein n=1 Tax=Sporothrix stenoceras TaxID=5173 RepID=A0ABR3YMG1_9PEZI